MNYTPTEDYETYEGVPIGDSNSYPNHPQLPHYSQQYLPVMPPQYAAPYGHAPIWPNNGYANQIMGFPPQPLPQPFALFDQSRNYHTTTTEQQQEYNSSHNSGLSIRRSSTPVISLKKASTSKAIERNVAMPPSKASGGIPEPAPSYLSRSLEPYYDLQQPQHLLVIIDLNGTLLHRPTRSAPTKFTSRPHTPRFLNYCITTFTVVIWSSARPENVKAMTSNILPPELRSQVVAIWGRDKFGLSTAEYNSKVQCYKRLTTVWNDKTVKNSHPGLKQWDQTNTVLIDDSNYKGKSEPFNLIEIPEYSGGVDEEVEGEGVLPQVHDYLNRLSMCSNVSNYLRRHPFVFQKKGD